jgi:hypothetical protein
MPTHFLLQVHVFLRKVRVALAQSARTRQEEIWFVSQSEPTSSPRRHDAGSLREGSFATFGDGVNVASRLQGLARPGGVCISDIVHQSVGDRLREPFRDMGSQRVKNISRPIRVWQWTPDRRTDEQSLAEAARHQHVQFATAPDRVQIAWASVGEGPPVLKAPHDRRHGGRC